MTNTDTIATRALGTTMTGDRITVTVRHDPRASYSRSVIPCAKRNVTRLGLWAGWTSYDVESPVDVAGGSEVTFVRIR